ncbi:ADP-ribosylation factor protein 3 [Agyrium rufum]|nr:ADP-ribosylation factor protein 3 [Agyrium rufum]
MPKSRRPAANDQSHQAHQLLLRPNNEYSILLLGLDNAGKTTLLNSIKDIYASPPIKNSNDDNPFSSLTTNTTANDDDNASENGAASETLLSTQQQTKKAKQTVPTVGQNVAVVPFKDMTLRIWDVGGQHALRGLWKSYYASCHAVVFVVDSSDVGDADDVGGEEGFRVGAEGCFERNGRRQGEDATAAEPDGNQEGGEEDHEDGDGDIGFHGRKRRTRGTGMKLSPSSSSTPPVQQDTEPEHESDRHPGRLFECRQVLESILRSTSTAGVPLLVLANKQDREDCVETVRIKEALVRPVFEAALAATGADEDDDAQASREGLKRRDSGGIKVRDSRVLPLSALTGTGVREAVEWVAERVRWNAGRGGRGAVWR